MRAFLQITGIICGIFFLFPHTLIAQNLTQTVRGTVTNEATGQTLEGINLQLLETSYGTATDAEGQFSMSGIPLGRYVLQVTAVCWPTSELQIIQPAADGFDQLILVAIVKVFGSLGHYLLVTGIIRRRLLA